MTVRNDGGRPVAATLAADGVVGNPVTLRVPRLRPGATKVVTYTLPTERRGVFKVGPLLLGRRDPFGLASSLRRCGDADEFFVYPRVWPVRAVPSGRARDLDGPTVDSAPQGSITFHALREYVIGDDLRHIHWKSTARTGQLMVKQHVDTSQPDTTIVLDMRRLSYSEASFETALEAVASIAVSAARSNFPVKVLASDGSGVVSTRGHHDVGKILDYLARCEMREHAPLGPVFDQVARGRGGEALVIVSGRSSVADAALAATIMRRFGRTCMVSCQESPEPPPTIAGMRFINAQTGDGFVVAWNAFGGAMIRERLVSVGLTTGLTLVALAPFHRVFDSWGALMPMAAAAVISATVVGVCAERRLARSRSFLVLIGAFVVFALVALFRSSGTAAAGDLVDAAVNGWARMLSLPVPVHADPDMVFLPVVLAWLASAAGAALCYVPRRLVLAPAVPATAAAVLTFPFAVTAGLWHPVLFVALVGTLAWVRSSGGGDEVRAPSGAQQARGMVLPIVLVVAIGLLASPIASALPLDGSREPADLRESRSEPLDLRGSLDPLGTLVARPGGVARRFDRLRGRL